MPLENSKLVTFLSTVCRLKARAHWFSCTLFSVKLSDWLQKNGSLRRLYGWWVKELILTLELWPRELTSHLPVLTKVHWVAVHFKENRLKFQITLSWKRMSVHFAICSFPRLLFPPPSLSCFSFLSRDYYKHITDLAAQRYRKHLYCFQCPRSFVLLCCCSPLSLRCTGSVLISLQVALLSHIETDTLQTKKMAQESFRMYKKENGVLGWEENVGHFMFQAKMIHPIKNATQPVNDVGLDGGGEFWSGEVELGVIGIEVTVAPPVPLLVRE